MWALCFPVCDHLHAGFVLKILNPHSPWHTLMFTLLVLFSIRNLNTLERRPLQFRLGSDTDRMRLRTVAPLCRPRSFCGMTVEMRDKWRAFSSHYSIWAVLKWQGSLVYPCHYDFPQSPWSFVDHCRAGLVPQLRQSSGVYLVVCELKAELVFTDAANDEGLRLSELRSVFLSSNTAMPSWEQRKHSWLLHCNNSIQGGTLDRYLCCTFGTVWCTHSGFILKLTAVSLTCQQIIIYRKMSRIP